MPRRKKARQGPSPKIILGIIAAGLLLVALYLASAATSSEQLATRGPGCPDVRGKVSDTIEKTGTAPRSNSRARAAAEDDAMLKVNNQLLANWNDRAKRRNLTQAAGDAVGPCVPASCIAGGVTCERPRALTEDDCSFEYSQSGNRRLGTQSATATCKFDFRCTRECNTPASGVDPDPVTKCTQADMCAASAKETRRTTIRTSLNPDGDGYATSIASAADARTKAHAEATKTANLNDTCNTEEGKMARGAAASKYTDGVCQLVSSGQSCTPGQTRCIYVENVSYPDYQARNPLWEATASCDVDCDCTWSCEKPVSEDDEDTDEPAGDPPVSESSSKGTTGPGTTDTSRLFQNPVQTPAPTPAPQYPWWYFWWKYG